MEELSDFSLLAGSCVLATDKRRGEGRFVFSVREEAEDEELESEPELDDDDDEPR